MGALLSVLLALAFGPDARVQAAAAAAPAEAVVVLDVASGRVIAQAGRADKPLPPGSTFKLVDVIAAGATRPEALAATVRCEGRAHQSGVEVQCPHHHGALTLDDAIPESCNIFFGAVGEKVGTRALLDTARRLGVGTGAGRLPTANEPAALVADGAGVLVTALEQARLVRQIAAGRFDDGAPLADAALLLRLKRGMRAAVERGTARGAAASVPVAGKTGSAAAGGSTIGWFIGFAPADEPTVAIAIARRGVWGSEAARSAAPILEAFFHGR
jgi:penicillin-binding protein 2